MKLHFSKLGLGVAASAMLMIGGTAIAQEETFVQCSSGGAVRDSQGDCVVAAGGSAVPDCVAVAAAPAPAPTVSSVSLGADAFFDFDRSNLKPAGQSKIDQLVSDMSSTTVNSIDIVGHTDSIGTEQYNQGLSERRARSAQDYMVNKGVNPGIITARGMGELQPVAPNDNGEGRAKNRRVDITVVAQGTQ